MTKIWNFGILGPGKIANRFADAFRYVPEAKVYAVASRDIKKAKDFASSYKAEKYYSSYEDLAKDRLVDIVYIATPHPFHFEQTMLCLNHGKPVLCEKPLAMSYRQASEMIGTSQREKVFLMEGMWSRFFPAIHKAYDLVMSGEIGKIISLKADFGFSAPVNLESRIYKLALGGGAQLDVGVYPMFLALLFMGKPDEIKATSQLASSGADATTRASFHYAGGAVAHILSSIVTDSPKEAVILGTQGSIVIQTPWYKSQQVSLKLNSGKITKFPFPHSGNGFEFQIEEVVRCLKEKKIECDLMPQALSLLMAEVSDEIRKQGGIKYSEG